MFQEIQEALNEIRPMLAQDGGDVSLTSVVDGIVTVQFTGHCAHCSLSALTLKRGIEEHLKNKVPGVIEVRQEATTPHNDPSEGDETDTTAPRPVTCPADTSVTREYRNTHSQVRAHMRLLQSTLAKIANESCLDYDTQHVLRSIHNYLSTNFEAHMQREEKELFPALKAQLDWGDPICSMLKEHAELRKLINSFGDALTVAQFGGRNKLAGVGGALSNAILEHLFREENVVYFEADDVLRQTAVEA